MIRKATAHDAGRIAEILVFNNRINYYPIFQEATYSFGEYNVLAVRDEYLKDPELLSHTFVYEDEVIKGFVCVMDKEIRKLYVEPFFQREGIGEQLLEFAVEQEKAEYLWALEKNTGAIRFYERHGFLKSDEKMLEEGTEEYLVKLKKSESHGKEEGRIVGDPIEIREATAEDAAELIAYTKIIGGESDNLTFGKEGFPVTIEQERQFLNQVHEEKTSVHLLACIDGEIVGDGSLNGMPRRLSHRAEMGLTVKKAFWNRGIGGMLIERLIECARENGIELINLEVRSDNANAIHLYKKFGFRYIGTSPAFFKMEGRYYDFDLMVLDLR